MAGVGDPIKLGFIDSLSRPGGNMTGLATLRPELEARSFRLLAELVPGLNRIAVLLNPDNPLHDVKDAEAAAKLAGVQVVMARARKPAEGMVDLGAVRSVNYAVAVNDRDQVVGYNASFGDGFLHGFWWNSARGMVDLDASGWADSTVGALGAIPIRSAINVNGEVVGSYQTKADLLSVRPVLWLPITNVGCVTLVACNLKGANLAGAYLKDRDLSNANLKGANLARANLSGAILKDTNMMGANLTNVNLTDARLNGANVKDVIWSNTICVDGTNSKAHGGTCVGHL